MLVAEVRSGQNRRLSGPNILSYGTWQSDLIAAIDAYSKRPKTEPVAEKDSATRAKLWSRMLCE